MPTVGFCFIAVIEGKEARQHLQIALDRALVHRAAVGGKRLSQFSRRLAGAASKGRDQMEQFPLAGEGIMGGVLGHGVRSFAMMAQGCDHLCRNRKSQA